MSVLTIVVILAMLVWAVWFAVGGLILGVRLLRRQPAGQDLVPAPVLRRIGLVLLVGVLGVLVATALLTAAVVTEREAPLTRLQTSIAQLDAGIRHLYEATLAGLESIRGHARGETTP